MKKWTREQQHIIELQIQSQRAWIAKCGGSRAAYLTLYGSKDDPEHFGDGGEAIYEADVAELRRLIDKVNW